MRLGKLVGTGIIGVGLLFSPLVKNANAIIHQPKENEILVNVREGDTLGDIIDSLDERYGCDDPKDAARRLDYYLKNRDIVYTDCNNEIKDKNVIKAGKTLEIKGNALHDINPNYCKKIADKRVQIKKGKKKVDDSGFSVFAKLGCLVPRGNLVSEQYGSNFNWEIGFGLELPILGIDFGVSSYSDEGNRYEETKERGIFSIEEDYAREQENFEITSLGINSVLKLRIPGSDYVFPYFGFGVGYQLVKNVSINEEKWKRHGYYESEEENLNIPYWCAKVGIGKPFEKGIFFGEVEYTNNMKEKNIKKGDLETISCNAGVRLVF